MDTQKVLHPHKGIQYYSASQRGDSDTGYSVVDAEDTMLSEVTGQERTGIARGPLCEVPGVLRQ